MYYICRFSESWSMYDADAKKSRSLTAQETELLSSMFGKLLDDRTKLISAVKIELLPPGKLANLHVGPPPG